MKLPILSNALRAVDFNHSQGLMPMSSKDQPTGNLCNDTSRTKEYVGQTTSFMGRKSQTIKCPCKDSTGRQFWGFITKNWFFEDDNTLSCPTQEVVMPHWTQPGQHQRIISKCVNPSVFEKVVPDDSGDKKI